jgi:hypothetical protein
MATIAQDVPGFGVAYPGILATMITWGVNFID